MVVFHDVLQSGTCLENCLSERLRGGRTRGALERAAGCQGRGGLADKKVQCGKIVVRIIVSRRSSAACCVRFFVTEPNEAEKKEALP